MPPTPRCSTCGNAAHYGPCPEFERKKHERVDMIEELLSEAMIERVRYELERTPPETSMRDDAVTILHAIIEELNDAPRP